MKILLAALCVVLGVSAAMPARADVQTEERERKAASVLYSDIAAYVNGRAIPTINIGGRLMVSFDALAACGFSSYGYNQYEGALYWGDENFIWGAYEKESVPPGMVGKVQTEIKYYDGFVVCGGTPVKALTYAKDAADKNGKDDENLDYYPIMFLSDAVKAMGGQYAYVEAERKATAMMPSLKTFEERLALYLGEDYKDSPNVYAFDDYAVWHRSFAKQSGPIDSLEIFYRDGRAKSLLEGAPTNAVDYTEGRNTGYVSDIGDITVSGDGKTMRVNYGYVVYIDLPSATVIKVERPAN